MTIADCIARLLCGRVPGTVTVAFAVPHAMISLWFIAVLFHSDQFR
ncbi:hypothetical protein AB4Y32_19910 [Paraburkholderia phymatum]|uniref:Uncharacterized protein n=1 Tax=Paraburkholderia phymatum TaxID=148447 RepID=A0ACC6U340_9BURK